MIARNVKIISITILLYSLDTKPSNESDRQRLLLAIYLENNQMFLKEGFKLFPY